MNKKSDQAKRLVCLADIVANDRRHSSELAFALSYGTEGASGIVEAVVLAQLDFWLENSTNIRNGRPWTFNSLMKLQGRDFPFFSLSLLYRALARLRDRHLVLTANFNRLGYDKTTWYSIDYEAVDALVQKVRQETGRQFSSAATVDAGFVTFRKLFWELYPKVPGRTVYTKSADTLLAQVDPASRVQLLESVRQEVATPRRGLYVQTPTKWLQGWFAGDWEPDAEETSIAPWDVAQ